MNAAALDEVDGDGRPGRRGRRGRVITVLLVVVVGSEAAGRLIAGRSQVLEVINLVVGIATLLALTILLLTTTVRGMAEAVGDSRQFLRIWQEGRH